MTMTNRQRFQRQVDARVATLRRETAGQPEERETSKCIRCTRRTVVTRTGKLVTRVVHEDTGLVTCTKPVDERCGVCEAPGILQCSEPGCAVFGHPSCLIPCNCCGRLFCPDSIDDNTCRSCAVREEALRV